jgi:hypothetical protein
MSAYSAYARTRRLLVETHEDAHDALGFDAAENVSGWQSTPLRISCPDTETANIAEALNDLFLKTVATVIAGHEGEYTHKRHDDRIAALHDGCDGLSHGDCWHGEPKIAQRELRGKHDLAMASLTRKTRQIEAQNKSGTAPQAIGEPRRAQWAGRNDANTPPRRNAVMQDSVPRKSNDPRPGFRWNAPPRADGCTTA